VAPIKGLTFLKLAKLIKEKVGGTYFGRPFPPGSWFPEFWPGARGFGNSQSLGGRNLLRPSSMGFLKGIAT